jgi:hypothetical protein
MDKEQARFILRSFRPDGADVDDVDFAEALHVATEDRELGEWLAEERAFAAAFSEALGSVKIPESLREEIFAGLAASRGDLPQAMDSIDMTLIGAFAAIRPPDALRGELIAAMERTASSKKVLRPVWRRFAVPLAAAAGVALAFVATHETAVPPLISTGDVSVSSAHLIPNPPGTVPVDVVQASFIRTFESPLFSLDENREKHGQLIDVLEKKKLPCPKKLPPGLVGVKGIGCRELVIDGKRGSLVCFDEPVNGTVHLVIFKREDVCGDLPTKSSPALSQIGAWAIARWADDGYVFVLLGSRPVEKLSVLFAAK